MKRLLAALAIPLGTTGNWQVLQFKNTKANTVEHASPNTMIIKVNASAGPVVHRLEAPVLVKSLTARGTYSPRLTLAPGATQGSKGADDFGVRLGIVVRGERRLNWMEKKLAPQWVLRLHDLAPAKMGVDRIEFVNLVDDPSLLGKHRKHPKSDLLIENFAGHATAAGPFVLSYSWPKPIDAMAIWISADGDDTKSNFEVSLTELTFETP